MAKKQSSAFLRVSLNEKVLFVKHLSIAVKSGMTLISGIQMIRTQTKSPSLKKILDTVIRDLDNGIFLSVSLEKYISVFGELFINIIRVGETSGTLTENLNYLADEIKKSDSLRKKVRGAMIYPAVVLGATFGMSGTMILFVFPKIMPIFQSLKVELPITTKIFIGFANLFINYWLISILSFIGLIILFILLKKITIVRYYIHLLILKLPIFGKIIRSVNVANMTRTMSLLLNSGIQIVEAITITSKTTVNLVYKKELIGAAEVVKQGDYFSKYILKKPDLFPTIMSNMISVGEETGNLSENLKYLSEYYESEVDDFIKNLSSIIEPMLLLIMGIVVGFIAISVISPIYSITETLGR